MQNGPKIRNALSLCVICRLFVCLQCFDVRDKVLIMVYGAERVPERGFLMVSIGFEWLTMLRGRTF